PLVSAECGVYNLENIVVRKNCATCVGAVVSRATAPVSARYIVVEEGAVAHCNGAVLIEYRTAQRPAATSVRVVGAATVGASVARGGGSLAGFPQTPTTFRTRPPRRHHKTPLSHKIV